MKTFAGIDEKYALKDDASIYLLSIPYDGTSTWGKGADKGFEAFLDAAENMELYDIETDSEVYLKGIHMLPEPNEFDSPEKMYHYTYQQTKKLLEEDKFLTFFGGEHSISIGIIQAFQEKYQNLTVVQIDAHADLRPSYDGSPYNHACAIHQANERGDVLQIGIRSMDRSEKEYMNPDKVYFAQNMHFDSSWKESSIEQMQENVYITLDLDAFDPAFLPGTGTPEPGGLDFYTVLDYLKAIFKSKNVVGFDIVELAPIEGHRASEFLAAKLYYKMLSYKFAEL